MNLVKWFRKNNKKVMAIVVVIILFGFIGGGTLLEQLGKRGRVGALAHFGEKNEITDYDLLVARRELEILRMLRAEALLRSQDLHGVFLGELLFSDQRASVALINSLQVVFAVDELAVSELGPFDVPKPRMFENIGPVKDMMSMYSSDASGIMAIMRVIDAQKASEPESIDQTYSTSSLKFDPNEENAGEDIYSVKEKVTEDLKKLAVLAATKSKVDEFIALAEKDGWTSAINKFEELYGQLQERDENDPNAFRLQNYPDMRRISKANLETIALQGQGDPMTSFYLSESRVNQQFVDQLYSLVPPDNDKAKTLPLVMEFKPDLSYYVIKDISVKRLFKEDYDKMKATRLFREDYIQSQSLAVIHYSPENILKRMNFKPAKSEEETANANTPAESEAAS